VSLPLTPERISVNTTLREAAQHILAEATGRAYALDPDLDVSTELSEDTAAAALVAASDEAAAVVVGSRGLGGFHGLLVGSVSAQVATHARSPVVVVRSPATTTDRIVVGVDGSPHSVAALGYAFEQADWRSSALVAVHAWSRPVSSEPGDILPLVYDATEVQAEESRVLAEAVAGWSERYPDVPVEQRVVRGHAASVLSDESREAQLLVVGSRGHGGFTGLLLGSVSHRVLHHARCPVAVVRTRPE
jgi:nucleotide-binding universal stress UspA family protein